VATYDYRCRTCDDVFEVRRSVTAEANEVRCPSGHDEVTRVWSAVAVAVGGAGPSSEPAPAAGCCGGGCCG
jgi:putative FmdB family regulatory protein